MTMKKRTRTQKTNKQMNTLDGEAEGDDTVERTSLIVNTHFNSTLQTTAHKKYTLHSI